MKGMAASVLTHGPYTGILSRAPGLLYTRTGKLQPLHPSKIKELNMATRLNNAMRAEILANVMDGAYVKVTEKARKQLYKVGRKVWETALAPYIKAVNKMPEGFHGNSTSDMMIRFKPSRGKKTIRVDIPRNFKYGCPANIYYWSREHDTWVDYSVDEDTKELIDSQEEQVKDSWPIDQHYVLELRDFKLPAQLVTALAESNAEYESCLEDVKQLRANVEAVLKSAYSIEKLLETWPDAAKYLPALPVVGKSLAINIPNLERMLDKAKS